MFGSRPRPAATILACTALLGLYMLVAGLPTASAALVGDGETGAAWDGSVRRGLSAYCCPSRPRREITRCGGADGSSKHPAQAGIVDSGI